MQNALDLGTRLGLDERRNYTSVFVFRQVLNNGIELVITLTYRGMVVGSEC